MSQQKSMLASIRGYEGNVLLTTVDSRTGRIRRDMEKYGCKKFVAEIPRLFKKSSTKAVLINVLTLEPTNYSNNYEFRKAIKTKLEQIKMPYMFVCDYQYLCSSILIHTNIAVEVGEIVLIVLVNEKGIQAMELKYTKNGYISNVASREFIYNPSENHETIRSKILGKSTPKKIIISPNDNGYPIMKCIKQILKFKDLIITETSLLPYDGKYIVETSKHLFDENYTKFWICPTAAYGYYIRLSTGAKNYDLLYFLGGEELPVKKEIVLAKQSFNFTFLAHDHAIHREEVLETFTLPSNCHEVKIILSIDTNNYPSYEIITHINPKIELLPEFLHQFVPSKVPVIGFFGNSSVICYHKNGRYQFLDGWNGVYGRELLISFASKKPTFMEAAAEDLRTKPSCVVLDLARITAMPINEIKHNGPWNFKFTKDNDNPILIEFDKADGTRGAAPPAFLMAMLLKEHLKALKDEICEKPTDIVFCLLDDFYKFEEQQRIQDQFAKACELLKINISFLFYFLLAKKHDD